MTTKPVFDERAAFEAWAEPKVLDGTIPATSMARAGISYQCNVLHAVFLAWQAHAAVGNFLTAEPCPHCTVPAIAAQADARDARIQQLEAQLAAIGAGGVESLRKNSTQ